MKKIIAVVKNIKQRRAFIKLWNECYVKGYELKVIISEKLLKKLTSEKK